MSKIIRKARSQLEHQIHSVKEDGLRRQLHSVRNEIKHSKRSSSLLQSGSTPGFKFSDIDNDDMDDFDWMETGSNTKADSNTRTGSNTRSNSSLNKPQTSDYYSSCSPESSYSSQDHTHTSTTPVPITDDSLFNTKHVTATTKVVNRPKVSSLFDDIPDFEDDHLDSISKDNTTDQNDPLRLNLYSRSPQTDDSLFDDIPLVKENPEHNVAESLTEDSDLLRDKPALDIIDKGLFTEDKNGKKDNENRLTNLVNSLFADDEDCSNNEDYDTLEQSVNSLQNGQVNDNDNYKESLVTPHIHTTDESDTTGIIDPPTVDSCTNGDNKNSDNESNMVERYDLHDNSDDELFMSATSKLITSSAGNYNSSVSKTTCMSNESRLMLSEVSDDPLSMMGNEDTLYDNDYNESDNHQSNSSHSLLPISEDHYTSTSSLDQLLPKQSGDSASSSSPPKGSSHQSYSSSLPSTPPCSSPIFLPKSKISPRTRMRLNRSGKEVPIVPPRPIDSKRTMSVPDPDTVSIISNVSSISAYSADEIYNRGSISNSVLSSKVDSLSSYTSGYTIRSDVGGYKPLESITESPYVNGETPNQQPVDNDYTIIILSLVWLLLYLYYSLNPFVYLAGFLAGFLVFYITIGSAFYWYVQHSERERERRNAATKKVELPSIEDLPNTIDTDFESSRVLESTKFGMVFQYYPATHHPSQRMPAKVKLYNDNLLEIRFRRAIQTEEGLVNKEIKIIKDLQTCSILIVPEEVAQNRKRRWSKKFPLNILWDKEEDGSSSQVFLFTYTSREKEEWFRRMRLAQEGKLYDDIVCEQKIFVRYMGKYMPHALSPQSDNSITHTTRSHVSKRVEHRTSGHKSKSANHRHQSKLASEPVRFSSNDIIDDDEYDTTVKLSSNTTELTNQQRVEDREKAKTIPKPIPSPPVSSSLTYGWINAGLARLAWDMWHEERWKKWVQSRIQRKLIRIKTPSFMEPLKVTAIDMGMDMPVIKRPFKPPRLDSRGIWIYMEVEYKGTFNMTIETKLKLQPKMLSSNIMHFNRGSESPPTSLSSSPTPGMMDHVGSTKPHPHHRSRLSRLKVNTDDLEEELSSGSDDEEGGHHLTRSLEEKLPMELEQQGIPIYSSQDDSGFNTSSSSSSVTSSNEFDNTSGPKGRKEKLLTNMVSRFQKMATKSKFVARAAEKVSSYPMTLSVEVKSLNGFLVINMAPPPSDALWFGFTVNPVLDLVAKPKLGQREVTLSYVTDWIEKKLCDVLEKKLVYPNMEDLVIPVLNSGLPEDKLTDLITSPS